MSASHPAKLFLIHHEAFPQPGELAVWKWPTRAYFPQDVMMVKRVLAVGPASLIMKDRTAIVNEQLLGVAIRTGTKGQPLPVSQWNGAVPPEWYLLGTAAVSDSWDSRYYGPVPKEWIIGTAIPLWHTSRTT